MEDAASPVTVRVSGNPEVDSLRPHVRVSRPARRRGASRRESAARKAPPAMRHPSAPWRHRRVSGASSWGDGRAISTFAEKHGRRALFPMASLLR